MNQKLIYWKSGPEGAPPNNNEIHKKLAELGRVAHYDAKKKVEKCRENSPNLSKIKIQKILEKQLESIFKQIDVLLHDLFGFINNSEISH